MRGTQISLPGGIQRLVAFLALHDRRPLQRTYVAGKLWFDTSDGRASANLRTALARLRQSGEALVEASRTSVRLGSHISVDVIEQTALARRVLASPANHSDVSCHGLLAGELLPDWCEPWIVFERERLRQLRLHVLELVAEQLIACGRHGEAVELALAALRDEPLRESAHEVLMSAYLDEGNVVKR